MNRPDEPADDVTEEVRFDPDRYVRIDVDVDFTTDPLASADHVYTPLFSTKQAEFGALDGVPNDKRRLVAPMMLLRPVPQRGAARGKDAAGRTIYAPAPTYEQHVRSEADKLRNFCADPMGMFGSFARLFVDVSPLQERNTARSVLADVKSALGGTCGDFVPVTDPGRSLIHQNAVKAWHAETAAGICVRLQGQEAWPTFADLEATLAHVGCGAEAADLVFDVGDVFGKPLSPLISSLAETMNAYRGFRWRRVTVAAGGFPATIKDFPPGRTPVVRSDLALWLGVRDAVRAEDFRLDFGDYGPVRAKAMEGGGPVEVPPNIRYTDTRFWLVYRRESRDEVHEMCRDIVADFPDVPTLDNAGDRWITERSLGRESAGSPENWVGVGLDHHVWFVVRQMNGLP